MAIDKYKNPTFDTFTSDKPNLIVRSKSSERDRIRLLPPTLEACAELQYAYDYFNDRLFSGELRDCDIAMRAGGSNLPTLINNQAEGAPS